LSNDPDFPFRYNAVTPWHEMKKMEAGMSRIVVLDDLPNRRLNPPYP
jgi:hypothetical protein